LAALFSIFVCRTEDFTAMLPQLHALKELVVKLYVKF